MRRLMKYYINYDISRNVNLIKIKKAEDVELNLTNQHNLDK